LARPAYILVQSELLENLEAALLLLPTDVPKPEIHVLDGESERYPQHDVQSLLSQREHVAQYQRVQRTPKEVADDVAFICFSSGTSGLVKGVKLTHRNVVANVHQQSQCLDSMYNPDTVFTLVVPFYHILGLAGFCVQYIANGAPIVVFKRFDMPEFLESISRDKGELSLNIRSYDLFWVLTTP
jgi:acyl-CoA synthetase (AMP-forming)/AMP-acid ligase II